MEYRGRKEIEGRRNDGEGREVYSGNVRDGGRKMYQNMIQGRS